MACNEMLVIISLIVQKLSLPSVQKLGKILGTIWFYCVPIRKAVAINNIKLALKLNKKGALPIARLSIIHLCQNVCELFWLSKKNVNHLITGVVGFEHYEKLRAQNRGILVVTAHMGNFDLLACSQAINGVPLAIVSKQLSQNGMNSFWMKTRQNMGLKVFEQGVHSKSVVKWLRSGNVLGLTVDQRFSKKDGGELAQFFNHLVWTSTTFAKLAIKTDAAILPVMTHRNCDGKHSICIYPPLEPELNPGDDQVNTLVRDVHNHIERWIEEYPDNWLWIHRRFKNSVIKT